MRGSFNHGSGWEIDAHLGTGIKTRICEYMSNESACDESPAFSFKVLQ
jgi:hypothetical protein